MNVKNCIKLLGELQSSVSMVGGERARIIVDQMIASYIKLSITEQSQVSSSVLPCHFPHLISYAKFSAANAVRQHSKDEIKKGLTALAICKLTEDIRDVVTTLCLLYNSAVRLGLDPKNAILGMLNERDTVFAHFLVSYFENGEKRLAYMGYREIFYPEFDYEFDLSVTPSAKKNN